jgi:DNA modification methylase
MKSNRALNYIGSELDKDYYEIIQKRLSAVQGSLF